MDGERDSVARRLLAGALLALPICGCVPADDPLECADGFLPDMESGLCLEVPLTATAGDVTVSNEDDLRAVCDEGNTISGDLVILPGLQTLDGLACLRQVGGSVVIEDVDGLEWVSLPALDYVGGDVRVQVDDSLLGVSLPALETVGGSIAVQYNLAMETLDLSSLTSTGGFLSIYVNDSLSEVDLPSLATVGPEDASNNVLYVRLNGSASRISMPELLRVSGVLKISSNHRATELAMPKLETIGHGLYVSYNARLATIELPVTQIGRWLYFDHTSATSISLPRLERVGDNFEVIFNEALTDISAPALTSVGAGLVIASNPELSQETIDAFIDGIDQIGGLVRVEDNGAR